MTIKIIIDNQDAGSVGGDWTINVYDSERPDDDGEFVAFGNSPRDALNNLQSEYALTFSMGDEN